MTYRVIITAGALARVEKYLDPLASAAAVAPLASSEVGVDLGRIEWHPCREPIDQRQQRLPMRFPSGRVA